MTVDGLRQLSADFLLTLLFGVAFIVLFAVHRWDLRRRRRRVAAIRASGDFGPNRAAVAAVVAAAGGLGAAAARDLAAGRRLAFDWDPRLEKVPKAARLARDRAFGSERDDVARAAAEAARAAARSALATADVDARVRLEAAECAAETAGALVAVERIPAAEFRMLTRAWRSVVGPVGVSPRREA